MRNPEKSRTKPRTGIGAKITEYRLLAGLSQAELAEKVQTSHQMVSYLELGKCRPTGKTIKKLCAALDITESCLHEAAGPWRIGQGGRMICPYCGKGQLRTKREVEMYGYQLDQIRFCIFCGREVKA